MSHQGGLSSRSPASVRNKGFGFAPFIGAPSTNHLSRILKMLLDVGCCEDWGSKPLPRIVPRLKFSLRRLRTVCIRLESPQNTSRIVDPRQRIKPGSVAEDEILPYRLYRPLAGFAPLKTQHGDLGVRGWIWRHAAYARCTDRTARAIHNALWVLSC